jgi:hypothetical protein
VYLHEPCISLSHLSFCFLLFLWSTFALVLFVCFSSLRFDYLFISLWRFSILRVFFPRMNHCQASNIILLIFYFPSEIFTSSSSSFLSNSVLWNVKAGSKNTLCKVYIVLLIHWFPLSPYVCVCVCVCVFFLYHFTYTFAFSCKIFLKVS